MIEQGEIYWAELDVGRHPLIVVSREELNRGNVVSALVLLTVRFFVGHPSFQDASPTPSSALVAANGRALFSQCSGVVCATAWLLPLVELKQSEQLCRQRPSSEGQ